VHGTTHQRPIDRFVDEAGALVPTASQASFLQAMVRERVVADDWLVSIDGNRYSVPCELIGRTVQVTREGGDWVIRHRGQVVARHGVLAGRVQLCVDAAHSPAARRRSSAKSVSLQAAPAAVSEPVDVEVRDLSVYDELLQREAA
jgi:hypothetical protein